MRHRLTITAVVAALALASAVACGGNPEPEGPTPEELAQMRQDSIRRAEEARQDSIRRVEQARQDSLQMLEQLRMETASAREIIGEMIHFAYDRSEIQPDAEATLRRKLAVLRANPDLRIRIEGHADERGSIEYNRALGQRRAEAARDFLMGFGISGDRLNTVSFGEDRPLVNASNEEAWRMNRRDEFTILAGGDQLRLPSGL